MAETEAKIAEYIRVNQDSIARNRAAQVHSFCMQVKPPQLWGFSQRMCMPIPVCRIHLRRASMELYAVWNSRLSECGRSSHCGTCRGSPAAARVCAKSRTTRPLCTTCANNGLHREREGPESGPSRRGSTATASCFRILQKILLWIACMLHICACFIFRGCCSVSPFRLEKYCPFVTLHDSIDVDAGRPLPTTQGVATASGWSGRAALLRAFNRGKQFWV